MGWNGMRWCNDGGREMINGMGGIGCTWWSGAVSFLLSCMGAYIDVVQ